MSRRPMFPLLSLMFAALLVVNTAQPADRKGRTPAFLVNTIPWTKVTHVAALQRALQLAHQVQEDESKCQNTDFDRRLGRDRRDPESGRFPDGQWRFLQIYAKSVDN